MMHKMLPNVSLYALSLYFVIQLAQGQHSCSCDLPDSDFATGVNLVYYKCNNDTPATIAFPITASQGLLNVIDENLRTIFYAFGYLEKPEDDNVQIIIRALCYGRTDNVVLLDWSKYSAGRYPKVFQNAEKIGRLFARSLQDLKNAGLDTSKIYLIGHSLGSHLIGFAGKCNDFKIPRITGLDPANSILYLPGCYLTPSDATWIDIIHTNMGKWGTSQSLGTAEYYANGGFHQPGCPVATLCGNTLFKDCSHKKSVAIYAYTKYHPDSLTAVQCDFYVLYKTNMCNENLHTGVGYAASNVSGSFYFSTVSSTA